MDEYASPFWDWLPIGYTLPGVCIYNHWGARVGACMKAVVPGSHYCEDHGGENEW